MFRGFCVHFSGTWFRPSHGTQRYIEHGCNQRANHIVVRAMQRTLSPSIGTCNSSFKLTAQSSRCIPCVPTVPHQAWSLPTIRTQVFSQRLARHVSTAAESSKHFLELRDFLAMPQEGKQSNLEGDNVAAVIPPYVDSHDISGVGQR